MGVAFASRLPSVGFIDAECGRTVIGYEVPAPDNWSGILSLGGSVTGLVGVPL